MSVCRRQIRLVAQAPTRVVAIRTGLIERLRGENIEDRRITPYPPNFNIRAAKTIDPATGASTWAFGSQRWVV